MGAEGRMMAVGVIDEVMTCLPPADRDAIGKWFMRRYVNEVSHDGAPDITDIQRRCLQLAAEGLTSAQIGKLTGRSARTVEKRLDDLRQVLGASNRVDMVVKAMRWGML